MEIIANILITAMACITGVGFYTFFKDQQDFKKWNEERTKELDEIKALRERLTVILKKDENNEK